MKTRIFTLITSLLFIFFMNDNASAQCTACPSYDFDIAPTPVYQTHSSSIVTYGCQMYRVSVSSGSLYRFTMCEGGGTASYDTYMSLYDNACGLLLTNDDACGNRSQIDYTATFTGYAYLAVSGYGANFGTYTLAYSIMPPPPDPCASIVTMAGCGVGNALNSVHTGTGVWDVTACLYSTPGQERIYQFTPTVTGVYSLEVSTSSGYYIDYFYKEASLGCDALNWTCIDDISSVGTYGSFTLTAGTTYYFLLDPEGTTTCDQTFYLNCPTPCTSMITIADCGVANSMTVNLTGSGFGWNILACGFSTPGQEQVYQFTPTVTGLYTLEVTASSGSYIDYFYKDAALGCDENNWTCIDDIWTTGSYGSLNLISGTTYYFLLDPEGTGAVSQTFYLGCPSVGPRVCGACVPEDVSLGVIGTTVYGYSVVGNLGNAGVWIGSFVGEENKTYHFDLCPDFPGSGTNFLASNDIDIKITDATCTILTGQDGGCSAPGYSPNDFVWTCPAAGTYYVHLAPYSSYNTHTCSGIVTDTFRMEYYKEPMECPANATLFENEPLCVTDYVDATNGGCNSIPEVYTELTGCNDIICAESGTYLFGGSNYRDTDWYRLTLNASTTVTFKVVADFDVQIYLIDLTAGCASMVFTGPATALSGDTATLTATLGPGIICYWVGPQGFVGIEPGTKYNAFCTASTITSPATPVVADSPACGSTELDAMTSPIGVGYYWQGTSCDTSTLLPASAIYPITASGTYYVRGKDLALGCWSACTPVDVQVYPIPADPTALGSTICEGGLDTLYALGSTGVYNWWDVPSGGSPIGTDTFFVTPILTNTTTYYVNGTSDFTGYSLLTTMAAGNSFNGNMFDLTVTNAVIIDSFYVNVDLGPAVIEVYYKLGTYVGFTQDAGPWILVGSVPVTGLGSGIPTPVPIGGLSLAPGLYGMYVTTTGATMFYTNGADTIADANLSIETGFGGQYPFNLINTPRSWNGTIFYTTGTTPCESSRVPVTVTVNPLPAAAGPVTGSAIVCEGSGAIPYSVGAITDASSYVWAYSGTGASINGAGSAITMDFPNGSTSGDLTVYGSNACGDGAPSFISIVVDPCTGIEENSVAQVNVVPNPNTGLFSIELSTVLSGAFNFKIYNELGQLVMDDVKNLVAGTNRIDIDMLNQPNGAYYLKIMQDDVEVVKAFLIQR